MVFWRAGHADGEHLFAGTHPQPSQDPALGALGTLPPHCLNVFGEASLILDAQSNTDCARAIAAPLVDITLENGATEFLLGSHHATGIDPAVVWQDESWRSVCHVYRTP